MVSFLFRCLAIILVIGMPMAAGAATPAGDNASSPTFRSTDWRLECDSNNKTLDCETINRITQQNGEQIVSIAVHPVTNSSKSYAVVQLPLGIALSAPVQLRVDGGQPTNLTLDTCVAQGCIASGVLSAPFVTAATAGTKLMLSFAAANNKGVTMTVPLAGFALAYDHMSHEE